MNCELSLRAKDLTNLAGSAFGCSDPFAVVSQLATTPEQFPKCLGQTEEVQNNLSPVWSRTFHFLYDLGTQATININIYDKSKKGIYRDMGSCHFDIGLVLESAGGTRAKKVKRGGTVYATIRKGATEGQMKLKLQGYKLKNLDGFLQKSDPYYEIHKRIENSEGFIDWEVVYRSRVVMDNLSPIWPQHICTLESLCNDDLNHPLRIIVFDHDKKGDPELIGEAHVTAHRLIDSCTKGRVSTEMSIPLYSKPKQKKGRVVTHRSNTFVGRQHSSHHGHGKQDETLNDPSHHHASNIPTGRIIVLEAHAVGVKSATEKFHLMDGNDSSGDDSSDDGQGGVGGHADHHLNFIDYVLGGLDLNVVFAIDYSGSNGDPMKAGTLHYLGKNIGENDYEKSILALLNILGKFDSDKHYGVWGFGAKYDNKLYNIFQCGKRRLVSGIEGVLETYRAQFRSALTMADTPACFGKVIRTGIAHAKRVFELGRDMEHPSYTILVILSDEDVSDLEETKQALIDADDVPLSVIFVGIGNRSKFPNMRFVDNFRLDRLEDAKRRDMAQFVHFNRFQKHSQEFTREALQEVPQQMVDFFYRRGILPDDPEKTPESKVHILPVEDEIPIEIAWDHSDQPFVKSGGTIYHDIFTELLD